MNAEVKYTFRQDLYDVVATRTLKTRSRKKDRFAICLVAYLEKLQWLGDARDLVETLPTKERAFDFFDCVNALSRLGYNAGTVSGRIEQIDRRLLPCWFFDGAPHNPETKMWLIAEQDETEDIVLFDPESQRWVTPDFAKNILGDVYFFRKKDRTQEDLIHNVQETTGFSWFRALMQRYKKTFLQIVLISLVINLIGLSGPLFILLIYDAVIGTNTPSALTWLVIGVVGALVLETALRYIRLRMITWLSARVDNTVTNDIFHRLLHLKALFTERSSVAAQLSRIKAFEAIRDFFSGPLFLSVIELPFVVVLIFVIALIAGPVALVPVVMIVLYIVLLLIMRGQVGIAIRRAAKANSEKQNLSIETLSKLDSIYNAGIEVAWRERLRELSGRASYFSFKSNFIASILESLAQFIAVLAGVVTIALGIGQVWANHLTIGGLVATMILVWKTLAPLQSLCTTLPRLEQLINGIAQVNRLMDLQPERDPYLTPPPMKNFLGYVKFTSVGLRYSKQSDPVFVGLSFEVNPGEIVAITGPNGAGKSTILKLINRLYTPQAGNIRIDGLDIRQLDPLQLRRQITYVAEKPDFFVGSIASNLRFSNPLASDDEIAHVLDRVYLTEEIADLSQGVDTIIDDSKIQQLPSGFAYRLSLARAYLKDSKIMLFDELPNALLNTDAGEAYREFIIASRGRNTLLFVSHRNDFTQLADKIITLHQDGRPEISQPDKPVYLKVGMVDDA